MLIIENVEKLIGQKYSDWLDVIGVKEHTNHYEFTLGNIMSNQLETILLHRKQTMNGNYVMEYRSKTLWLSKSEFDTMDKIIICMQTI